MIFAAQTCTRSPANASSTPFKTGYYANVPGGATLADEKALGARPYLVMVPATQLIAGYVGEVNGENVVVHARIAERHLVRDGYVEKTVDRVRVLEPGRFQIFSNLEGQWALEQEGEVKVRGQLLDRVPLFTFYAGDKIDDFWCVPPFLDLAYKNIQHYQLSSDDDHARLAQQLRDASGRACRRPDRRGRAGRLWRGVRLRRRHSA